MKKLILILALIFAIGTIDSYCATPKRATTAKKTAVTGKKTATKPSMPRLAKALETSEISGEIKTVADLDKKLTMAANFQAKHNITNYKATADALSKYIGNSATYNSNGMAMAQGYSITVTYSCFATLQKINKLISQIPAESVASFKKAIASLYAAQGDCTEALESRGYIEGTIGMGSMAYMEVLAVYEESLEGINNLIDAISQVVDGAGTAVSTDPTQALNAFVVKCTATPIDPDYMPVSMQDFNTQKSNFTNSGRSFITAYNAWLAAYPGHSDKLANLASIPFTKWQSLLEPQDY